MTIRKTMRQTLAAAGTALMLLASLPVQAFASEEQTTPGGVKFSELSDKVDEIAEKGTFASFGYAVFSGDEIVSTKHYGEIDMEGHIAADENTVYEWGSITKTTIWVSAMQLYEQGKLDLNADVRGYLPANFLHDLKYDEPITFLNLMNHNAGFCESTYLIQTFDENAVLPLGKALQESEPPQIWRPGEITSYSNWGAALAGYIIECISGMPYSDYVHKNIFEPLGMEHTAIAPDHKDTPWVREQREKLKAYGFPPIGAAKPLGPQMAFIMLYPAGAATGTIADLAAYAQGLCDPDAPLFEKPETQEMLFSGSAFYGSSELAACCHGFWPEYHGVTTVGHDGGTSACSSIMTFDRESGLGYVWMTNGIGKLDSIDDMLFGKLDAGMLPAGENTDNTDISGFYSLPRSTQKGLLRFVSRLNLIPILKDGSGGYKVGTAALTPKGSGLLQVQDGENTGFYGTGRLSDGTPTLQLGSMDAFGNPLLPAEFGSLCLYALIAVICVILLLVKLIQRIAKKRKHYAGMGMITLAQLAKIASLALMVAAVSVYSANMGLTKQNGMIFGIAQGVCGLIFALAALSSFGSMFSKKEKAKAPKYLFNFLFNAFAAAVVVYFQMYQFWGI